jgi:hypothetical protein
MFKIRILTDDFHTFEPYRRQYFEFQKRGIEIGGSDMENYDITLIGHSVFQDKKLGSFEASLQKGMDFLKTVDGPYILVDGQDSTSLIGAWETFIESDAICMLKHSLLKDRNLYNESWVGGRYYWGKSEDYGIADQNWKAKDFDKHSDKLFLSGTNWIGVPEIKWFDYSKIDKLFDVSGLFSHPHPECHEFDLKPSQDFYYNEHRNPVLDIIKRSPFMVAKLYKGRKFPLELYYKYLSSCKVILAPFGYGEMAPRDLESCQFGSILIKPDMSYVDTFPSIYESGVTYLSCKHDYSDLEDVIEYAVLNFNELRDNLVNNIKRKYHEGYTSSYLVDHTEILFNKLGVL